MYRMCMYALLFTKIHHLTCFWPSFVLFLHQDGFSLNIFLNSAVFCFIYFLILNIKSTNSVVFAKLIAEQL